MRLASSRASRASLFMLPSGLPPLFLIGAVVVSTVVYLGVEQVDMITKGAQARQIGRGGAQIEWPVWL